MSNTIVEDKFKLVVNATALALKSHGYRRRGLRFTKEFNGNIAIIAFQKSRDNTDYFCKFTVNLAIVCGLLWNGEFRPIDKANDYDGHLQERIGNLMPVGHDFWWTIDKFTDGDDLAVELKNVIESYGVSYLDKYIDVKALFDLWSSGRSPGLTEFTRKNFIDELRGKI
jgi:hypothetical protein